MTNYYHILGLEMDSAPDEIKQAYRKLSMKFHPDKNPDDKYFEEWTKNVNAAYEILSDPQKRESYDRALTSLPKPGMQAAGQNDVSNGERLLLEWIRSKLPEYYEAKNALDLAQSAVQEIEDQESPVIITPFKAILCTVGILLGLAGLWYAIFK